VTRHSETLAGEPAHEAPERPRPPRPGTIELAGAILIVGGVLGLFGALTAAPSLPAGTEPFLLVAIALDVGSIVIGVLVRTGRAWILAVNYVAVLGFLDLLAAGTSQLALMVGLADLLVVVILIRHKPWFDAMAAWRRGDEVRLNP